MKKTNNSVKSYEEETTEKVTTLNFYITITLFLIMQCLSYRYGIDCHRVIRTPHHIESWMKYQLCFRCSKSDKTKEYRENIDIQMNSEN